jgi:hypothetical protein
MLINKDPANAVSASLSYTGFTPAPGAVTTVSYLKGGTALTTATAGTAASQSLPPYSITTLQLNPVGGKAGTTAPATSTTPPPPVHRSGSPTSAAAGAHGDGVTSVSTASGNALGHNARAAGASIGPLALTGAGSVVTYGLASVIAIAAGSAFMLRRRNAKSTHRR